METSNIKQAEVASAHLEYADQILKVTIKEGSEIDQQAIDEQLTAREEIIEDDSFCVLVDATRKHQSTKEARSFLADFKDERIKAMGVVSRSKAIRTVVNFVIVVGRPKIPTRLFNEEDEALEWIKKKLG